MKKTKLVTLATTVLLSSGLLAACSPDKPKEDSSTPASSTVASEKTEDSPRINIYNNLPYIERLENGWSNQAPTGMIALSFKEFDDILMKHWRRLYNESK